VNKHLHLNVERFTRTVMVFGRAARLLPWAISFQGVMNLLKRVTLKVGCMHVSASTVVE
jgi:hypothetical protein